MKYFLDQDNSGHWYLVPVEHKEAWKIWSDLDEDDEASWEAPEYAQQLGTRPSCVQFENPEVL